MIFRLLSPLGEVVPNLGNLEGRERRKGGFGEKRLPKSYFLWFFLLERGLRFENKQTSDKIHSK
jgi:hypothetical protein